jgi:UDP-glucose 4-epimerase
MRRAPTCAGCIDYLARRDGAGDYRRGAWLRNWISHGTFPAIRPPPSRPRPVGMLQFAHNGGVRCEIVRSEGTSTGRTPHDRKGSESVTKYLVTGGAGFIGSHIATGLVERGEPVRILDDLSSGSVANFAHLPPSQVEFVRAGLNDRQELDRAVRGVDVVFHQAALASVPRSITAPLETHAACATGTVELLDACRNAGVRRIVYAASSSCYGNEPVMPKSESQLPQVLSPYAAAKLAGELYCECFAACYQIETVRLRYFNVFGPRQDPASPYSAVIPLFVSALLEGRRPTIFGDGSQSRDFTYVENIVHANWLAANAPGVSGKVYNIACGTSLSVAELLKEICRLIGREYDPIFAPPRAGDVQHSWADISAAQRELDYAPTVDFPTGLRRTIDWYVQTAKTGQKPARSS